MISVKPRRVPSTSINRKRKTGRIYSAVETRCYGCCVKRYRNGTLADRSTERARWVNKYRASGLGLSQFAHRHGLRLGQLHYWVYQSPKPPVNKAPIPAFQEVRLPATVVASGSWSTEIGLPDGTTVRLARETDVAWAMALIYCLGGPCSSRCALPRGSSWPSRLWICGAASTDYRPTSRRCSSSTSWRGDFLSSRIGDTIGCDCFGSTAVAFGWRPNGWRVGRSVGRRAKASSWGFGRSS